MVGDYDWYPPVLRTGMLTDSILYRQPHHSWVQRSCHFQKTLWPSQPLAFTIFPCPLLWWSLSLAGRGYDTDVPFMTEHSSDTYSLHFDHCEFLYEPLSTWQRNFFYVVWSENYSNFGYRDINLEDSLILCSFSIRAYELLNHGFLSRYALPDMHFLLWSRLEIQCDFDSSLDGHGSGNVCDGFSRLG